MRLCAAIDHPLGIHGDAVSFQTRNCRTGFWLVNLATEARELAMVSKKREQCACVCKKWCTRHAAWQCIAWLGAAMNEGRYRRVRQDGSGWRAEDDNGASWPQRGDRDDQSRLGKILPFGGLWT